MTDGSRKKYKPRLVLISEDDTGFVQIDADDRYPERHGPKQLRRNFNPALRDGIAFWRAHYPLFLRWIASRGETPQETR